eukprot:SM000156S02129  [mRNA]  locus=s156:135284:137482:+ [translate_table: standard]
MESFATPYPVFFADCGSAGASSGAEPELVDKGVLGIHSVLTFKRFQQLMTQKTGLPASQLCAVFVCRRTQPGGSTVKPASAAAGDKRQKLPINENTNFNIILNQHNPLRERDCHFLISLKKSKRERKVTRKKTADMDVGGEEEDEHASNDFECQHASTVDSCATPPASAATSRAASTVASSPEQWRPLPPSTLSPRLVLTDTVPISAEVAQPSPKVLPRPSQPVSSWQSGTLAQKLAAGAVQASPPMARLPARPPQPKVEGAVRTAGEELPHHHSVVQQQATSGLHKRPQPNDLESQGPSARPRTPTPLPAPPQSPLLHHTAAVSSAPLLETCAAPALGARGPAQEPMRSPVTPTRSPKSILPSLPSSPSFKGAGMSQLAAGQKVHEALASPTLQQYTLQQHYPLTSQDYAASLSRESIGSDAVHSGKSCKFCSFCEEKNRGPPPFHWCVNDRVVIGFKGPSPAGPIGRPFKQPVDVAA